MKLRLFAALAVGGLVGLFFSGLWDGPGSLSAIRPGNAPAVAASGPVFLSDSAPLPTPVPIPPDMATPKPRDVPSPEALRDIDDVQFMLRDYRTRLGENPEGTNAEIMKVVMGGNRFQARLGPPEGQRVNEEGELIDRWGAPYFFHQLSKNEMEVRSAGPDRAMWTADDIVVK